MDPVALIGACAVRRPTPLGRLEELVFDTASSALADAGLERTDLDAEQRAARITDFHDELA